jgi:hypothetical protein
VRATHVLTRVASEGYGNDRRRADAQAAGYRGTHTAFYPIPPAPPTSVPYLSISPAIVCNCILLVPS